MTDRNEPQRHKGHKAHKDGRGGDERKPAKQSPLTRFLTLLFVCFVFFVPLWLPCPVASLPAPTQTKISIGSKAFPESWILGEALSSLARQTGTVDVEHRSNLGGT